MSDFWVYPREDILRTWWPVRSGAQVAAILGNGCTREMVIGKAYRLGLVKQPKTQQQNDRARQFLPRGCVLVEMDGGTAS